MLQHMFHLCCLKRKQDTAIPHQPYHMNLHSQKTRQLLQGMEQEEKWARKKHLHQKQKRTQKNQRHPRIPACTRRTSVIGQKPKVVPVTNGRSQFEKLSHSTSNCHSVQISLRFPWSISPKRLTPLPAPLHQTRHEGPWRSAMNTAKRRKRRSARQKQQSVDCACAEPRKKLPRQLQP